MTLVLNDRVLETCTSPGTGSATLLGATTGFRTFSAGVGNGNTCYYTIADQNGGNWEVGLGTYTSSSNSLARTTVLSSSNAGSLVNFSSGTQNVFVTYPAEKAVYLDASGNLTLSGSITLSGGTANGVLYLNGSKAVTSGSVLTFDGTTLKTTNTSSSQQSNGYAIYNDTGVYTSLGTWGSAAGSFGMLGAGSGYLYTGSTDLNLVANNASGVIKFASGGNSEKMRLTSAGYLGIGTSSPGSPLSISTASGNTFVNINAVSTDNTGVVFARSGTTDAAVYYLGSSRAMRFDVANAEAMRLDSSGNLGLGVTPSAWNSGYKAIQNGRQSFVNDDGNRLQVLSNAYVDSGGSYRYIASAYASLDWYINGERRWYIAPSGTAGNAISFTQAMTLDASGNLGLGTTTVVSGARFDVRGPNSNNLSDLDAQLITVFDTTNYAQNVGGGIAFGFKYNSSGSNIQRAAVVKVVKENSTDGNYASALIFGTTANSTGTTEKMRLDSSGNLGLGVTPSAWVSNRKVFQIGGLASAALALNGTSAVAEILANAYQNTSGTYTYSTTSYASLVDFNSSTAGGWVWKIAPSGTAGNAISWTQAMTLDASGNLGVGATSLNSPFTVQKNGYDTTAGWISLSRNTDGSSNKGLDIGYLSGSQTTALVALTSSAASAMSFWTFNGSAWGERARIDSSGNLLVGTTSTSGSTTNLTQLVGGVFSTLSGSGGSFTSGVAGTIFTMSNISAGQAWLVSVTLDGEGATYYNCTYIVVGEGSGASAAQLIKGASASISVSGLAVQYTQSSGGTKTNARWSAMRIL